ncbi:MAG: plasmid replication protein RepC, partial [Planktotalea sp.]|uniref:plasmid replication protein RepC n=1 Tax=Planktotalea sp. TaxID=2029877 RepID=UPI003C75B274
MSYHPRTPFRRAYDAARLKDFDARQDQIVAAPVNKWDALRELGVARAAFGLSDRTLTVLQALLGFHPENELSTASAPPIVYPSNATICARLNGMPCSTMRRHLAALIKAGFLIRRDSPNGKRFKRDYGTTLQAFGFDLSPLVIRFEEVQQTAERIRASEAHIAGLRLDASLMRRDLAALSELARFERPDLTIWDAFDDLARLFARELRRKLDAPALSDLTSRLANALEDLQQLISRHIPTETSSSTAQIEHQHQNSNKDIETVNSASVVDTVSQDIKSQTVLSVS